MELLLLPLLSILAFVVGHSLAQGHLPFMRSKKPKGAQALRLWSLGDQGSKNGGLAYLEEEGVGKATQMFLTALFDNPTDFEQEQEAGDSYSVFKVTTKDPKGPCVLYHKAPHNGLSLTIGPKASPTARASVNYQHITLLTYAQLRAPYTLANVESIGHSSSAYSEEERHLVRVYERISGAIDNAVARSIDLSSLGASQQALLDIIKLHPEEAPKFASDPILGPYCQKILAGAPLNER